MYVNFDKNLQLSNFSLNFLKIFKIIAIFTSFVEKTVSTYANFDQNLKIPAIFTGHVIKKAKFMQISAKIFNLAIVKLNFW